MLLRYQNANKTNSEKTEQTPKFRRLILILQNLSWNLKKKCPQKTTFHCS